MKRLLVLSVAALFVLGVVVAVVAILNARDPYGGPIEPAAEH